MPEAGEGVDKKSSEDELEVKHSGGTPPINTNEYNPKAYYKRTELLILTNTNPDQQCF